MLLFSKELIVFTMSFISLFVTVISKSLILWPPRTLVIHKYNALDWGQLFSISKTNIVLKVLKVYIFLSNIILLTLFMFASLKVALITRDFYFFNQVS